MTPDELIEIALGNPDGSTADRYRERSAADPGLADRVDAIRLGIDRLLDDGDDFTPPTDLADRTLAFVAHHRERRALIELAPATVPFRWVDLAVAASIFLAGLATLMPAAHRTRVQSDQTVCSFNLGQLGRGLAHYAMSHGAYPYPKPDCPAPYAALYKVILHDSGELDDPKFLDCPCNGHEDTRSSLPSYASFCALRKDDPQRFARLLDGDYAYHLGYQRPSGRPSHADPLSQRVALLSDRPPLDASGRIIAGNSPNHHGNGQNVAFNDGHVGWHPARAISPRDGDMFLNKQRRPEPGLDPFDAVLAPGIIPFFPRR